MLENSLWFQFHPEKSIREALSAFYDCDPAQISVDEGHLYAIIKRNLTKKELRLFIMKEAGVTDAEVMKEIGLSEEKFAKSLKKAYHKLRNKVRSEIKAASEPI